MIVGWILGLIACLCAAVACPYGILKSARTSRLLRWVTIVTGLMLTGLAYAFTFHYVYSPNANTRIHGWPVPYIVFQRDAPGEPWLDFVGPTLLLAFPINLVLALGIWFFVLWYLNALVTDLREGATQQPPPSDRPEAAPEE